MVINDCNFQIWFNSNNSGVVSYRRYPTMVRTTAQFFCST